MLWKHQRPLPDCELKRSHPQEWTDRFEVTVISIPFAEPQLSSRDCTDKVSIALNSPERRTQPPLQLSSPTTKSLLQLGKCHGGRGHKWVFLFSCGISRKAAANTSLREREWERESDWDTVRKGEQEREKRKSQERAQFSGWGGHWWN